MTAPVELVLFDMDGVLADTEPIHLDATNRVLASAGVHLPPEEAVEFLGGTDRAMFEALVDRHPIDLPVDALIHAKDREIIGIIAESGLLPRAGVCELLVHLKMRSIPAVVASSSSLRLIQAIVEVLGLGRSFTGLYSGQMVENSKPAPDVFLLGAREQGIDPARCLVIEDSPNGIAAGKAAGMRVLAVRTPYTEGLDLSAADRVVDSLSQYDPEELE